ncbi:Zn(2)-C6 fungal-type DNA-binding domain [Fusarium oxysporum f. sp. vasinfectum]|nr:Zn(2)-C6 fungal-type DNA-binding domain [Fusarium oxysporum f. sp. vasinfectum]KAK2935157.1 Zn2-C6 fungal-type DNA-binding domain [Fusarium oxysporum f. sp. vasinfectum]
MTFGEDSRPLDRDAPDEASALKARKACINCRKQKMKCVLQGSSEACRRCRRAGLPCVFVPRANAAQLPTLSGTLDLDFKNNVLSRLKVVEERLSIVTDGDMDFGAVGMFSAVSEQSPEPTPDGPLWNAIVLLQRCSPAVPPSIWQRDTIESLWSSMPGLHFMPDKQTFSTPQPILLASILYCSSSRGPPDVLEIAPQFFTVLCNAIAQLSIPSSEIGTPRESTVSQEEWAFQTVLGIVLAGLLTEGNIKETGNWIAIGYRLMLDYCPAHVDDTSREWRKLFSGIQIVDLEHSSIYLSCPVIPIEAPLPILRMSPLDQLYKLSRMMHTGLSHFTGRRLPTIWSCFQESSLSYHGSATSFTAIDGILIKDWAKQLDDWLQEFKGKMTEPDDQSSKLVLRQYVLHRLLVLSIYHPARSGNLWAHSITSNEQEELLLSARATLKLHQHDDSIWANWDLIMITWAALIVLQGLQGGVGEIDDMRNIRLHLDILKQKNEPKPSLCDKLIARLEDSLQDISTPDFTYVQPGHPTVMDPTFDYSWQLFDQVNLQQIQFPG